VIKGLAAGLIGGGEPFITKEEVAKGMRKSTRTIERWMREGAFLSTGWGRRSGSGGARCRRILRRGIGWRLRARGRRPVISNP